MSSPYDTDGYEFDDMENSVFTETAFWLLIVAIGVGIQGVLNVISGLRAGAFEMLATGAADIAVAAFLILARGSMQQVVATEGNDIEHAMSAVKSLRVYFTVQAIGIIIAVGVLIYQLQAVL